MYRVTEQPPTIAELDVRRINLQEYARRTTAVGRGRDHWRRMGLTSADEFTAHLLRAKAHPGEILWATEPARGPSVTAYVNDNRWLARCECGGLMVVDIDDPKFYCVVCFNMANGGQPQGPEMHGGYPRPVCFPAPAEMAELEATLLAADDVLWRNWSPWPDPGDNRRPTPDVVRQALARLRAEPQPAGLPRKPAAKAGGKP